MSVYLGNNLLAGSATNTKYNANNLLDWKYADHDLNDASWLKADTFSWQNGITYSDAYNHLVADMTSGAGADLKTETIGSYTVSYYLAADGHKIVMPDQETTISNIYSESGVAWYYVLDQTNQRFKLPRSSHGNIIEKYQNGDAWYRIYSDGWCEQGGQITWTSNPDTTITFLKTFRDTYYQIYGQVLGTAKSNTISISFYNKTANSVIMYPYSDNRTANWIACGYLLSYPSNSQYKYLYFYVGEYSQSATEQTAGLNAELFNGKADDDLSNVQRSIISGYDFSVVQETVTTGQAYSLDLPKTIDCSKYKIEAIVEFKSAVSGFEVGDRMPLDCCWGNAYRQISYWYNNTKVGFGSSNQISCLPRGTTDGNIQIQNYIRIIFDFYKVK